MSRGEDGEDGGGEVGDARTGDGDGDAGHDVGREMQVVVGEELGTVAPFAAKRPRTKKRAVDKVVSVSASSASDDDAYQAPRKSQKRATTAATPRAKRKSRA